MQRIMSITLAAAVLCVAGCATSAKNSNAKNVKPKTPAKPEAITFASGDDSKLGTIVRHVGEQSGGGIALMQALEWYDVGPLTIENASLDSAVATITAAFNGKVQHADGYYFLYPAGYEALEQINLKNQLPESLRDLRAQVAFGAGTPMYSVLAVLSRTLNTTLVADNAIAGSQCGEIALPDLPLSTILEAVMKSARIPQDSIEIVGGEAYAFIRRRDLPAAEDILINRASVDGAQQAMLAHSVSLELPRPQNVSDSFEVFPGASPLKDVLPVLSNQIGVPVTAENDLADLPVNPMVVNALPRSVAMELLIRQWLVPRYGYTVEQDRFVIRERLQP